jgi:uracil-DNA glycosylase
MGMKLEASWHAQLKEEIEKPYVVELKKFLAQEKGKGRPIYPQEEDVFAAFSYTPFAKTSVVLVGQDPYHGPGQAHGLCFSVRPGIPTPPSLQNMYKELHSDLGLPIPNHGYLINWAKQGILMLNATLTVEEGQPKSHYGKGWEQFTDAVIAKLAERKDPLVFILWGKSAQEKCDRIDALKNSQHLVLRAAHPSPFSVAQFFGCKHFSKTNAFLKKMGKAEIDWRL